MKRERAEKLFDLLGQIDDKMIIEADDLKHQPVQVAHINQKRNMPRFLTIAAAVAFLMLSVGGIAGLLGQMGIGDDLADEWDLADDFEDAVYEEVSMEEVAEGEEADQEFELTPSRVDDLRINPAFYDVIVNVNQSTDGMELIGTVINHSDEKISLDDPSLEYFDGEVWWRVPTVDDFELVDISFSIPPGGVHEFRVDLSGYIIPEGYPLRIRKTVWPDGQWHQTDLHHDLVDEFELDS